MGIMWERASWESVFVSQLEKTTNLDDLGDPIRKRR